MKGILVEDNSAISKSIVMYLAQHGIVVDLARLGNEGLQICRLHHYDFIILDLMLPDIDGYEVLMRLRAAKIRTPVLIVSGLLSTSNKIRGLSIGADDYITKPFDYNELLERINAVVRRSRGRTEAVVTFGPVTIHFDQRVAEVNGRPISLTKMEFSILELLAMKKDTVVSKETFLTHLYYNLEEPNSSTLGVFICNIRRKLAKATGGKHYIDTVWGGGYILRDKDNHDKLEEDSSLNETMNTMNFEEENSSALLDNTEDSTERKFDKEITSFS